MIPRVLPFLGLAALALVAACGDGTRAVAPVQRPPSNTPPPFPQFVGQGMVYNAPDTTREQDGGNTTSRIILYYDSTFGVLFSSSKYGLWVLAGQYSRRDSVLTLRYTFPDEGVLSDGGVWQASAIVRGDSLRLSHYDPYFLTLSKGVYLDTLPASPPPGSAVQRAPRAGS